MAAITLSALNVYPVKSAAGIALSTARVDARGLAGDRRWMVVDENRTFLTQRMHPRLALVSVAIAGDGVILTAPRMPALAVSVPTPRRTGGPGAGVGRRVRRSPGRGRAGRLALTNGWRGV